MCEEIKQALVKGTNDEEFWVRSQAVRSIGKAGDNDAIPLLERIMQSDPGDIPAAEPGKKRFPVREEALKAISLIKNKEKRKPM
jgi:HEAT repeat protein